MGLEAKQDGVQQAWRPERDGMFTRRAQPSPDGRKEGFCQRTLNREIDAACIADRQLDRDSDEKSMEDDGKEAVEGCYEKCDGLR